MFPYTGLSLDCKIRGWIKGVQSSQQPLSGWYRQYTIKAEGILVLNNDAVVLVGLGEEVEEEDVVKMGLTGLAEVFLTLVLHQAMMLAMMATKEVGDQCSHQYRRHCIGALASFAFE